MSLSETLLIVDDNQDLLELLADFCKDAAYNVYTSSSLTSVKAILPEIQILDFLITDVQLPDGDGHAVAGLVTDKFPLCRVIYISALHDHPAIHKALQDGKCLFFKKPVSPNVLVEAIRS